MIKYIHIDLEFGWLYGLAILFILVGASNAVNLTDGLDGLAGGLSAVTGVFTFGIGYHCGKKKGAKKAKELFYSQQNQNGEAAPQQEAQQQNAQQAQGQQTQQQAGPQPQQQATA